MNNLTIRQQQIEFKAADFISRNPHVYEAFVNLALEARSRGMLNYSANGLFEVLRWSAIMTDGQEQFKLSNDHKRHFSIRCMEENPRLRGFFRIKALATETTDEEIGTFIY